MSLAEFSPTEPLCQARGLIGRFSPELSRGKESCLGTCQRSGVRANSSNSNSRTLSVATTSRAPHCGSLRARPKTRLRARLEAQQFRFDFRRVQLSSGDIDHSETARRSEAASPCAHQVVGHEDPVPVFPHLCSEIAVARRGGCERESGSRSVGLEHLQLTPDIGRCTKPGSSNCASRS